ncbi:MAG: SPASM domain-containing protein [Chloroflexales bacterium]|nr:SPASM domain-containing protein [Chloroflexales bacterium]
MLEHNRPIIEYIIQKAYEVGGAKLSAVTNGTDLHAYRDLLDPDLITIRQITLDGPPHEHDQRRTYADGQGSFARIADNITMALDLGVRINVRLNIDRHNIHFLPALADEISARGWKNYPTFNVYTAPVQATNGQTDTKTTFSSWELDRALNQMRIAYPDTHVIDRPDDRLKNQACMLFSRRAGPLLRSTFCGAHTSMYIFDLFGDVYACWKRTGDPHIRIGAVTELGEFVFNESLQNVWRSRDVTMNTICRRCRYGLYCGGGCASQAEKRRGKFFAKFCDGFAARFRTSVAEAYLDHVAGVAVAASPDRGCDR